MHKYRTQIKKVKLLSALFALLLPLQLFAQVQQKQLMPLTPVYEIQQSYVRGEIDADAAALKQYKLLYNSENIIHKCATPAHIFFENNREKLAPETVSKIEQLVASPQSKQKRRASLTHTSASGKFEIVYETSGPDSVSIVDNSNSGVPDYVELVAFAADSSYRHQVVNLGFKDPIPPGYRYRIELIDITYYGETRTTQAAGADTYIVLENDFDGFPANTHPDGSQTGAVYATVAHEFKHAIQYAQNEWKGPSGGLNWSEMDATLMEEVVFDDANDHYNYIKNGLYSSSPAFGSIFYAPEKSTPGAYNHVSWMIFYSELYGNDLWREVWELIEADNFLSIDDALRQLLPNRNADFESSFVRNHLWHFASGARSGSGHYGFEEKLNYPNANLDKELTQVPTEGISLSNISTLAARYIEIKPSAFDEGFADFSIDFDSSQVGIGLLFYMKDDTMKEKIATGEGKSQVYLPTEILWQDVDKLGIVVANFGSSRSSRKLKLSMGKTGNAITIRDPEYVNLPKSVKVYQNYPNPFNPQTRIDFELPRTSFVELEVFDLTGRKVRTLTSKNYPLGAYSILFNARGLSSGVYFYRLRIDEAVFTKKMTLIK